MRLGRKELGYALYSRLEEGLRGWLCEKLILLYGENWNEYIPIGIWEKAINRSQTLTQQCEDPFDLLDETDLPDLLEIISYKKGFKEFDTGFSNIDELKEMFDRLYYIRCSIAHVKRSFSAVDLDVLLELSEKIVIMIRSHAYELSEIINTIKTNPEAISIEIPLDFFVSNVEITSRYLNNLPSSDYDPDGGFVGRKEDLRKIKDLVNAEPHRNVITVLGAGGVGKTAIVHRLCQDLLLSKDFNFDALIWVSAKEEKLTVTGIEPINPTLRSYEDVLTTIVETFDFKDYLDKPLEEKEEIVNLILKSGDKGILLVVDNLETIRDERVIEFLKDFPPPSKVIITSRKGLGEVERRYPLKEMVSGDAVALLRTIAREKDALSLAKLPNDILVAYVEKMSRYPLAIKWVVGLVALGKDMDTVIEELKSSTGDVAKFSFEQIYSMLNDDAKMVLYSLTSFDKPLVRGVLSHVANLSAEQLDDAIFDLTLASLVVPSQFVLNNSSIETKFELLPLTRNFIQSKLQAQGQIQAAIRSRVDMVENLIEEAEKAGRQYRYSLHDLGAETEEERIAATWALTAFQKYQADDYNGAIEAYTRAAEIAPKFPAIYRNWASMENLAGYHEKANDLMKKATSLSPNDSRLWFVWGNIEKRRQRYDRAFEYFKKALDISPNDPPILGSLGEIEKRRGKYENAEFLIKKALTEGILEGPRRRHELVCYTTLADNYRRWAEELGRDHRYEDCIKKLEYAYEYANKAVHLGEGDYQAQATLSEVTLDLAIRMRHQKGFDSSIEYFKSIVKDNPKKAKDKRINERACFYLSVGYLELKDYENAKKYYQIGKRSLIPGKYTEKYNSLSIEFTMERHSGTLFRVVGDKGYGFIESDFMDGRTVFLHYSELTDVSTIQDFEELKGSRITYLLDKNERGFQAKRAHVIL